MHPGLFWLFRFRTTETDIPRWSVESVFRFYHKTVHVLFPCYLLTLCLTGAAGGATSTYDIRFRAHEFDLVYDGNYVEFSAPGCEQLQIAGAPQLPMRVFKIALPGRVRCTGLEINEHGTQWFDDVLPRPAAEPWPYSRAMPRNRTAAPDPEIYLSNDPFPKTLVEQLGTGYIDGHTVIELAAFPLRVWPQSRRALFHPRIEITLHYQSGGGAHADPTSYLNQVVDFRSARESPTAVESVFELNTSSNDARRIEVLIVTPPELSGTFERLARWRSRTGCRARVVSTAEIYQNSGMEKHRQIRRFLSKARAEWGTQYVLLAGDAPEIPAVRAYVLECMPGGAENGSNLIPCDLYYGDLQGEWDGNGNGIYGEADDGVDLYPDLFIGRAPVNSVQQARVFIDKVLSYEQSPDVEALRRILFAAEVLWWEPYHNSGEGKDYIEQASLPPDLEVTKLYHHYGNESVFSVTEELNRGVHLFNHDGHASTKLLSVGDGNLLNEHADRLMNENKYCIVFSIGCWPCNFESDCIAEHFMLNPRGGSVAFIGNTRYGWGSPGNPKYGISDRFDQQFYNVLYRQGIREIGRALAVTKAHFVPLSREANVYRWCLFELTLLGDPAMPVWLETPERPVVLYPQAVSLNAAEVKIRVERQGRAVGGARVCVWKSDEFYSVVHTDAAGEARCPLKPLTAAPPALVTVTGAGLLPYTGELAFEVTGPHPLCSAILRTAASESDSNRIRPGETVHFGLRCRNFGDQAIDELDIEIQSQDKAFSVLRGQSRITGLDALGTADTPLDFQVRVDSSTDNNGIAPFEILFRSRTGAVWTDRIHLKTITPILSVQGTTLPSHRPDMIQYLLLLQNRGEAEATDVTMEFVPLHSGISIDCTARSLGDLQPGAQRVDTLRITLEGGPFTFAFPKLAVNLQSGSCPAQIDTLDLAFGRYGHAESFESVSSEWRHGGQFDFWHRSQARSWSSPYSFCFSRGEPGYPALADAYLVSPPIFLGPGSKLAFRAWYDVALFSQPDAYGDGLYVEVGVDSDWRILDFIGTGGALLMGNDWLPYEYDLSDYPPGTAVQIRFRFISDGADNDYEGFYLDDIILTPNSDEITPITALDSGQDPGRPCSAFLGPNYPNPFNSSTQIRFGLERGQSNVRVVIYDLLGRRVLTLHHGVLSAGEHVLRWNGCNEDGNPVASGIYLCRVETISWSRSIKLVHVK